MSFSIEEESTPFRCPLKVEFCKGIERTYTLIKENGSKYPAPEPGDYFCIIKDPKGKSTDDGIYNQANLLFDGQTDSNIIVVKWRYSKVLEQSMKNAILNSQLDNKLDNAKLILQSNIKGDPTSKHIDKLDDLDYVFIIKTQEDDIKHARINVYDTCQAYLSKAQKKKYKIDESSPSTEQNPVEVIEMEKDDSLLIKKNNRCNCCERRPLFCGHVYGFLMWLSYGCTNVTHNVCCYACCFCC
jgi:hypothetical protein